MICKTKCSEKSTPICCQDCIKAYECSVKCTCNPLYCGDTREDEQNTFKSIYGSLIEKLTILKYQESKLNQDTLKKLNNLKNAMETSKINKYEDDIIILTLQENNGENYLDFQFKGREVR